MRSPLAVFSGNSHPRLTEMICKNLGISVGKSTCSKFSNNETNVSIDETVRDVNVFIIQTASGDINDIFIEMLIMIAACKTASARKVTAVIPSFPYARQSEAKYSIHIEPTIVKQPVVSFKLDADGPLASPIPKKPQELLLKTPDKLSSSDIPLSPVNRIREESQHRKRFSSISSSQPNVAISSLTPAKPPSNGYKRWSARPGTLIANTYCFIDCRLMAAGCDHVITMDLHDPQFQGKP
jgi:ribose-phosphate pyrophosphokinase